MKFCAKTDTITTHEHPEVWGQATAHSKINIEGSWGDQKLQKNVLLLLLKLKWTPQFLFGVCCWATSCPTNKSGFCQVRGQKSWGSNDNKVFVIGFCFLLFCKLWNRTLVFDRSPRICQSQLISKSKFSKRGEMVYLFGLSERRETS